MSEPSSLLSLTTDEFLSKVGAKTPTPGGGAVAGLTASLAVGMAKMVFAYSLDKAGDSENGPQATDLPQQLTRLDGICRGLIDEDVAAYEAFREASQKVKKEQANPLTLQEAVLTAITVPLELLAMSVTLLRLLDEHRAFAKPALLSDLAVAAHLAQAACRAANETVQINVFELDSSDDRTHVYRMCEHYLETADMLAKQIVSFVRA